jgi:hypothetical protein
VLVVQHYCAASTAGARSLDSSTSWGIRCCMDGVDAGHARVTGAYVLLHCDDCPLAAASGYSLLWCTMLHLFMLLLSCVCVQHFLTDSMMVNRKNSRSTAG